MNSARQTRQTAPAEHLNFEKWEFPDLDGLNVDQKQRFHSLVEAVRHYISGGAISKFLSDRDIHREVFYRAFDKCMMLDSRGKPLGWMGLLPRLEVSPRQRRAPIERNAGSRGGLGGALQLFFSNNEIICSALHTYIDKNAKRKRGGEAGIRHKSVHVEFLQLCRTSDPEESRWPFTSQRRGAGAIRMYVCKYLEDNYDKIVATQFGDKAATKSKSGTGYSSRLQAFMPFDIVEMDEHSAGFIGSVKIQTPEGVRILDAGRLTILLMAERDKGWILSFKVIFRDAANSGDVLDVIHAGMTGEPGYAHRKIDEEPFRPLFDLNKGFGWCGFNCLLLDNALIHLAEEVVSRTMAISGCAVNFGPVHTPARRQLVERIFNDLERAGFKRLKTTVGSGPHDPKRQNPEAEARGCTLTDGEIVQLIANLVHQHNLNIGKQNLGASPYQRMDSLICGEEKGKHLFPFLPPLQPGDPDLSKSVVRVSICGNIKTGRRPYFSYLEADYTSPEIAKSWPLVGKSIVLHVNRSNIRFIPAFNGGEQLGSCMPAGRWHWSDHSIDLRRHINQLTRAGYLDNELKGDIVAEFAKKMGEGVTGTKATKKAAKSSVRQWGDHATRKDDDCALADDTSTQEAEEAVNDLLDRSSKSTGVNEYVQWDDIGAINGDGNES